MRNLLALVFRAIYNADTFRAPANRQQRKDYAHNRLMFLHE